MSSKNIFVLLNEAIEDLKQIKKLKTDLIKLSIIRNVSQIVSFSLAYVVLAVFAGLFLLLISVSLALVAGAYYNSYPMAFAFLALFYLLSGILIFVFRHKLLARPIMNKMIAIFFKENKNNKQTKNGESSGNKY